MLRTLVRTVLNKKTSSYIVTHVAHRLPLVIHKHPVRALSVRNYSMPGMTTATNGYPAQAEVAELEVRHFFH